MIQPDGHVEMLEATTFDEAKHEMAARKAMEGAILAFGTEDEINAIAQRVKLGAKELDARAARRKMQRESKRRNR
jgi:hypothetical protein